MEYIQIILLAVGIIGLVMGYRKNQRNLLLSAAIVLFLAGAVADFAQGVVDGYSASWSSVATAK